MNEVDLVDLRSSEYVDAKQLKYECVLASLFHPFLIQICAVNSSFLRPSTWPNIWIFLDVTFSFCEKENIKITHTHMYTVARSLEAELF